MKLTTKQLKQIIAEELNFVLNQNREMNEFFTLSDKMLMLNEGKIKDFLAKAPKWFSSKWKIIKDLAKAAKLGIQDIYYVFKAEKGMLYKILSVVGWNLDSLLKIVKNGIKTFTRIQQAASEALANAPGIKQAVKAGKFGSEILDEWFEKNPWMKKIAGPAVGALLIVIWLNMAFTGDWDYDFDQTAMIRAMQGDFSLEELFFSADGKRLLMLLFAGSFLNLSFPWLAAATSGFKLVVSVIYTMGKEEMGKTDTVVSLSEKNFGGL